MSFILEHLRLLDFFGIEATFFFQSSPKIQTFTGMIITMIILIYTIFLGIFFGIELFQRRNQTLYTYRDYSKSDLTALNTSNFMIAIVLKDVKEGKVDLTDEFFSIEVLYESTGDHSGSNKIALVPCKKEFFEGFYKVPDQVIANLIENGTCIDLNNNIFEGAMGYDVIYEGLKLKLGYDMNKYFENLSYYREMFPIKIQIFYQSFLYEKDNFEDPFKKNFGIAELPLTINEKGFYLLTFLKCLSNRDEDFFFTKINQTSIFGYNQFNRYTSTASEDTQDVVNIFTLSIFFESYTLVYSRRFAKIPEVLAQIVSFLQVGLVVGNLIIKILQKGEILSLLTNMHFKPRVTLKKIRFKTSYGISTDCRAKLDVTNEPSLQMNSSFKIPALQNSNIMPFYKKNKCQSDVNLNKFSFSQNQLKEEPFHKLITTKNLSKYKSQKKFCTKRFCCRFENAESVERKIIEKYLDIGYLLRSYEEFSRLLLVLFNKEQMYLFKHIGKCYMTSLSRKVPSDRHSSSCYFMKKMKAGKLNEIDEKMLSLLNDRDKNKFFSQ